jgi:hypothetical protein
VILRWLATVVIGLLLAIDIVLPGTSLGRRGSEAVARADVDAARLAPGDAAPALDLLDLEGRPIAWENLRGHRVLITFERSVDW